MIFYFLRAQVNSVPLVPCLALQIFQNSGNMIYVLEISYL